MTVRAHAAISTATRAVSVLALSVVGACIVALVFFLEDHAFLSRDDGAHAMPMREQLPYVLFALQIAVAIGVVTAPFAYVCTLKRSLPRAFVFVLAIVLIEIVVVTPIDSGLAFGASLLELALGLVLCRILPPTWLVARAKGAASRRRSSTR